jgi:hypothetical protein
MALNTQQYLQQINAENFNSIALDLFKKQYYDNSIYRSFVDALKVNVDKVNEITQIPFLPISFFKTHKVVTGAVEQPALIFESSGTTGDIPSRHFVADEGIYEQSLLDGFRQFYGYPADYTILALLPSYLERKNASLVHMAKVLMRESKHAANGFYLDEWDKLSNTIRSLEAAGQKVLLLGVTFALLDFAEAHPLQLKNTIVMETGGMKGRKEEWTRQQVHAFLKQQWQLSNVHSEYGMTELLSQAYAKTDGIFHATHTFKALIRDVNDPLDVQTSGTGCLNIIDLANIYSCSFIATEDIGRLNTDGSFEVLGRVDHAALRGCSLMVV